MAARYWSIVDSWVSYLPEVMKLKPTLREQLSLTESEQARAQGHALDLYATVAALLTDSEKGNRFNFMHRGSGSQAAI